MVFGQSEVRHPIKNLQHDFRIFRGALEESHAGIYWYRTKAQMDSWFDEAYQALSHDMTELEFYRVLSPLIAKIGCGHTWIATTEPTQNAIWEQKGVLPLKIKFMRRRAYCVQNNSVDSLSILPGQEILSIHGFTIDSLLKLADKYSHGDGFIQTGKMKLLDNVFNQFYTLFIGQPSEYVIEYRAGEETKTLTLKATPLAEVQRVSARRYGKSVPGRNGNLRLNWLAPETALLRVAEFSDWKVAGSKIDFKDQLKECFRRIDSAMITNLVIDLRNNDGGNEKYGLLLYSYLTRNEFIGYKQIDFRNTRFSYRKYTDINWLKYIFLKAVLNHKKINDSTYILTNDKATGIQSPSRPTFSGKTFILVNGGTFSTASDFTAIAHSNKVATVVGEETAGSYSGNTSNYVFLITLPNSRILVNVPIARYQLNTATPGKFGRGVLPDHTVVYSIDDILTDVDRDVETVMRLIGK